MFKYFRRASRKKCDLLDRREARLELGANCKTRLWKVFVRLELGWEKCMRRMVIVKITVHRLRDKLVSHGNSRIVKESA